MKKVMLFLAVVGSLAMFAPAATAATPGLGQTVLDAVRSAGFKDVLDGGELPNASAPWYPQIADEPQLDITILDLNADNGVRGVANVLMSRDYPNGILVPVGRNLSSREIRFRAWSQARFDETGGVNWNDPWAPGSDVVAGREGASLEFMLPYPASVLKVMVAHGIMRQVDAGTISLDDTLAYPGGGGGLCGGASTKSVSQWMQDMITFSGNKATCALILRLHQLGEIDPLNQHFIDIGLPSLQLKGTNPVNGAGWSPGQISMGSLDTAKLMWLTDGGPGVLWRTDAGDPVTSDELSETSRAFLKDIYSRQGFNEVLSTTNWCGNTLGSEFPNPDAPYPAPGIPNATPDEFLTEDGNAEVDGIPYPNDVGPCNDAAEVLFSHKNGLTTNFGSDVGFVHELDGNRNRDYVISVITNLGNRFTDPVMNTALSDPYSPNACWTQVEVCYSEAFAKFGKSIDDALKARPQIAYEDSTAKVGESFELAPSLTDVGADVTWSISPAPPAGLSFDRDTGVISGTPVTSAAARSFTVQAEDETGPGDTTFELTIDEADPPPVSSPRLAIRSNPARLRIQGRIGSVKVVASNTGNAGASGAVLCASVPGRLNVRGSRCVRLGSLSPGSTSRVRFLIDVPRFARTRSYVVRFTLNASDASPVRTRSTLVVPGR